ncbi:MAG: hypothetical protein ACREV8_02740 [Gammaproteobacteria bacterium]
MNADQVRALRSDFYAALGAGKRRSAHRIAGVLRREATDPVDWGRWNRWFRATRRGHQARIGTWPVEVYAGEDLERLDEARRFLGDSRRVADAVQQLKEAEG